VRRATWIRDHVRVRLRPFDPSYAELVAGWAVGDEVVRAWCAAEGDSVPADVVAGWSQAGDVEAYVFTDGAAGELVAYGELWLDDEEAEVELARLLVAPEHRGRGVGRELTRALVDRAHETHPELPAVILRVRPENQPAIRAYTAAGFVAVPADDQEAWNHGQRFAYHWMVCPAGPASRMA
jgi:RimJ/RimL family protein N-acetyltransferase